MLDKTLITVKRFIPRHIFDFFQPAYHWLLSLLAATYYGFPSKELKVIAVTGTKGKSSTVELISAMLEKGGHTTAVSNTIRFKIGNESRPNLHKMSMPGRFAIQKLLRNAVDAGCQYMVMEITSQGVLLHRHKFIDLDVLVFTNLSPEHIEAHGSYENYVASKVSIAKNMCKSKKPNRAIIVNADDKEADKFLACDVENKVTYSIHDVEPYTIKKEGIDFTLNGIQLHSHLSGLFNLYNIIAAIEAAKTQKVSFDEISSALEQFTGISGRVEKIVANPRQNFQVVVDYAHTADSLEKFYQVFSSTKNICILGGTGGGRDRWKRTEMGKIADRYCAEVILTDEDPYDEDPNQIVSDVAEGVRMKKPTIIMDRRLAIREAIHRAKPNDAILITGKGTDPYIMGPRGTKTPWSDAKVAEEEIQRYFENRNG